MATILGCLEPDTTPTDVPPPGRYGALIVTGSRKLASTILILAFGLAVPGCAMERDLYLIVLAGQSNMVGAGDPKLLPADFPKNGSRIWNFTNAYVWEPAKEPLDDSTNQVDEISRDRRFGVGPGLAMADAFAAKYPDVKIGLIPCAKSGSRLVKWQPSLSRDSLYGSCLNRQKEAEARGKVRAVVFWQGGQDGKDKDLAERWSENVKKMVTSWRADIGDPTLPFILLVLKPGTEQTLKDFPYRDIVREQQLSVELPYLTKIETIGYDYYADDIHMTTPGQLALGPVIAAALPPP